MKYIALTLLLFFVLFLWMMIRYLFDEGLRSGGDPFIGAGAIIIGSSVVIASAIISHAIRTRPLS